MNAPRRSVGYNSKSVVPDKVKQLDCRTAIIQTFILRETKPVTHYCHTDKNLNCRGKYFSYVYSYLIIKIDSKCNFSEIIIIIF